MSNDKDGGSAFPQWEKLGEASVAQGGMSLRDYFAAKAMDSIIAHSEICDAETGKIIGTKTPALKLYARFSYAMADQMLAARKEPQ